MFLVKSIARLIPVMALALGLTFSVSEAEAQSTTTFEIQNTTGNSYPLVLFKICEIANPGNCMWVDPATVTPSSTVVPGTNNYIIPTPGPGWEVRAIQVFDGSGGPNDALVGTCPGLPGSDDVGNDTTPLGGEPVPPVSTVVFVSSNFACIYN